MQKLPLTLNRLMMKFAGYAHAYVYMGSISSASSFPSLWKKSNTGILLLPFLPCYPLCSGFLMKFGGTLLLLQELILSISHLVHRRVSVFTIGILCLPCVSAFWLLLWRELEGASVHPWALGRVLFHQAAELKKQLLPRKGIPVPKLWATFGARLMLWYGSSKLTWEKVIFFFFFKAIYWVELA